MHRERQISQIGLARILLKERRFQAVRDLLWKHWESSWAELTLMWSRIPADGCNILAQALLQLSLVDPSDQLMQTQLAQVRQKALDVYMASLGPNHPDTTAYDQSIKAAANR